MYGWSLSRNAVADMRNRELAKNFLTIDQAQAVLTVRAVDLGGIYKCASFHQTSASYKASEANLHLANLQTMLWCATCIAVIFTKLSFTLLLEMLGFEEEMLPAINASALDGFYSSDRRDRSVEIVQLKGIPYYKNPSTRDDGCFSYAWQRQQGIRFNKLPFEDHPSNVETQELLQNPCIILDSKGAI
ncbi:hypothetical protein CC80DRAFT_503112 [Byssothecium circinans]|uniref:Uncharacterized protein n=1 Tax=Byssothecium circinans TaxID=147558 RepID=A0A6A5UB58_9PLEO|nr:hypothetical protein CC80DRAFT_503112 [Byssothecium circinans]